MVARQHGQGGLHWAVRRLRLSPHPKLLLLLNKTAAQAWVGPSGSKCSSGFPGKHIHFLFLKQPPVPSIKGGAGPGWGGRDGGQDPAEAEPGAGVRSDPQGTTGDSERDAVAAAQLRRRRVLLGARVRPGLGGREPVPSGAPLGWPTGRTFVSGSVRGFRVSFLF